MGGKGKEGGTAASTGEQWTPRGIDSGPRPTDPVARARGGMGARMAGAVRDVTGHRGAAASIDPGRYSAFIQAADRKVAPTTDAFCMTYAML